MLWLLLASVALTAEVSATYEKPEQEIFDAWRIRSEVISVGQDPLGAKELERIRKLQNDIGLRSIPLVSIALLREKAEGSSSITNSSSRIEYADLFTPNSNVVDYFHCSPGLSNAGILHSLMRCFSGLANEYSDNGGRLRLLSNAFLVGFFTFLTVSFVYFFTLLVNYSVPVCSYFGSWYRSFTPRVVAIVFIMLTASLYLYGGLLAALLALFIVLWRFMKVGEVAITCFLFVVAACIPIALYAPALHLKYLTGIERAIEGPAGVLPISHQAALLQEWTKSHPEDAEALFALALIEKRLGRYNESAELFEKSTKSSPKWHKPIVNLGIAEYLRGNTDSAIAWLNKAITVNPSSLVGRYNLGKIYIKETRLDEARTSLAKAKDIDPKYFAQLERKTESDRPEQFLVDEEITPSDMVGRVWKISPHATNVRNQLFENLFPTISIPTYWALLAITLIIGFLLRYRWPGEAALEVYERRARTKRTGPLDVFSPSLSLPRKPKLFSLEAAWFFFKTRGSSFVFPGTHHFFRGNYFAAVFVSGFAAFFLCLSAWNRVLLTDPYLISGLPRFPMALIAVPIFLLIYIHSNVDAIRN